MEIGEHEAQSFRLAECPQFVLPCQQELHSAGDLEAAMKTTEDSPVLILHQWIHFEGTVEVRESLVVLATVEGNESQVIKRVPFEAGKIPGGGAPVDDQVPSGSHLDIILTFQFAAKGFHSISQFLVQTSHGQS
jgi:hypothetical protein